jgi:hypothetical protein
LPDKVTGGGLLANAKEFVFRVIVLYRDIKRGTVHYDSVAAVVVDAAVLDGDRVTPTLTVFG